MGTKTMEEMAREKIGEFRSKEAIAVASDLLECMEAVSGFHKNYVLHKKVLYAKIILAMEIDVCPEKVTKKYFADLMRRYIKGNSIAGKGDNHLFVKIFVIFIRRGLYNKQEMSGWDNPDVLCLDNGSLNSFYVLYKALNTDVPFKQMQVVYGWNPYKKKNSFRLFVFDDESDFIKDLFKDAVANSDKFRSYAYYDKDLFVTQRFKESFGDLSLPTNLMEFTPETFRQQVMFFYNETTSMQVKGIKSLYMYIINRQGETTPFTLENGADISFVERVDVVKCIQEGYRTVKLSTLHEIPAFDNWMITPDPHTGICSDIRNQNRLRKCSFQGVPMEYKEVCKRWFISKNGFSLIQNVGYLPCIKEFLQEIEETHRKVRSLRTSDGGITFRDVTTFIDKDGQTSEWRRLAIFSFLNYIRITGEISVDPACFRYISSNRRQGDEDEKKPIPKDEYIQLLNCLREISMKEDVPSIYKITFALFVILSLLELRPNSLLSLKISDIREYGSHQYCVVVPTKTSRSHKKTYSIPKLIYDVLNKVKEYTAEYRSHAPYNIRDMLFLNQNGKVVNGDLVNRILKKVCSQCGIGKYTMRNIRKTYMTNVAKSIRDKGGSAVGLEQLFDHESIETTFRAYAKISDEEILMAISDTKTIHYDSKVKNHIKSDVEMDKKQLVSDGAGYCQKELCTIDGMADCFICPHFITSLDFYDSFVLKRDKIRSLMETDGFGEEIREGFLLIIRILDMYIAEMDTLMASK